MLIATAHPAMNLDNELLIFVNIIITIMVDKDLGMLWFGIKTVSPSPFSFDAGAFCSSVCIGRAALGYGFQALF
jgi:hypothetical protein